MQALDENAWDAWAPDQLFEHLRGINAHWYIVGGWALDLWHGQQTRAHDDLEFAVLPKDARQVMAGLSSLAFFAAQNGALNYQAGDQALLGDVWQYWGADMRARAWRVDMMLERGTPYVWRYKRAPDLCQARACAVRQTLDGIPYLAPANVLLFKAKHCRAKDEQDFSTALPKLDRFERANLRAWLSELHPNHAWIRRL